MYVVSLFNLLTFDDAAANLSMAEHLEAKLMMPNMKSFFYYEYRTKAVM